MKDRVLLGFSLGHFLAWVDWRSDLWYHRRDCGWSAVQAYTRL